MNESSLTLLKEFIPRTTFWKVVGILISVVSVVIGAVATMSVSMDTNLSNDLKTVNQKLPTIDRIDERTIGIQRDIEEIKTILIRL